MPQKPNVFATKTIDGSIHIFDYYKHQSFDKEKGSKPNLILTGHDKEGYGLSWSPTQSGYLLSGSDDRKINLYKVE